MKTRIEVTSKQEGEQLQMALSDPTMRATNLVFAALRSLDNRARRRAMAFVQDYYDDLDSQAVSRNPPTEARTNGSGNHDSGNSSSA